MVECNPYLILPSLNPTKGGGRYIEEPTAVENIIFQTRAGPLTDFENRFATELMDVFAVGHEALEDVAAALNATGSVGPTGEAWTPDLFETVIARLGAALFATVNEEQAHG